MQPIGKEVQESLEFIPAKAILKRDIYYTYCIDTIISTRIVSFHYPDLGRAKSVLHGHLSFGTAS